MFEKLRFKYSIKKNRKKYSNYYDNIEKSNKYISIKRKADFKYFYLIPKYNKINSGFNLPQQFESF